MSPIGDGEIQAYLDGASDALSTEQLVEIERRLVDDEAFVARVEEARAMRQLAVEILGESGPSNIVAPPFEELQRRAATQPVEGDKDRRWVRIPPVVGLGWAATVILALGVGWFAGQGAGEPMSFSDAVGVPALDAVVDNRQLDTEGLVEAESEGGGQGFASSASDLKKKEDLDQLEVRRGAGQTPEEAPATITPGRSSEASLNEVVAVGGELGAFEERQDEPNQPASQPEVASSDIVDRQNAVASPAPSSTDDFARAEAEQDASARRRGAREANKLADETAPSGAYAQTRDALLAPTGEHVLHSLAVPGLEVLGVSLDDAGALSGLKILHLLPTGDTLEVRYVGLFSETADPRGNGLDEVETDAFPAFSAQLQEAALPPGWRQVVVRKENRWVVARAPISEAQIRAYLMTLN